MEKGAAAAEGGEPTRARGTCKWFNVSKGFGFITPEGGGEEIFVHQSVIKKDGFRSLADGEEVEYTCRESDKGLEAAGVTGPGGIDCQGSKKKLTPKHNRRRVNRCYNCGEMGHHAKDCMLDPQPKKCHHCKSQGHLIASCPTFAATDTTSTKQKKSPDSAE